jgi:hypothetical protein
MQITLLDSGLPAIRNDASAARSARPDEVHMSECRDWAMLKRFGVNPKHGGSPWYLSACARLGFIHEEALGIGTDVRPEVEEAYSRAYGRLLDVGHVGELRLDGIVGSPDGVEESFRDPIDAFPIYVLIHEAKVKWASVQNSPVCLGDAVLQGKDGREYWGWFFQVACYMKLAQAHYGCPCDTAIFHPIYVSCLTGKTMDQAEMGARDFKVRLTEVEINQYWAFAQEAKRAILAQRSNQSHE